MIEDDLIEQIKKRTKNEWTLLLIKRFFLKGINFVFILGLATIIILTNINQQNIIHWVTQLVNEHGLPSRFI
jgi:cytochrome c biogenesis protein CcdA